tara:strand:- start:113 stop:388 length:276 start_codon:yes stop_codon:yes gene_type:complete
MSELNTQIELIVSEIIGATRKAKTLEDLGQANTNGINDITKLVKNLSLSGVSQQRELLNFRRFMVKGGYGSDEIRSITKESIDDFIKFNCG